MLSSTKNIIKLLTVPKKHSRKGQNGKLLVIGGSKKYHGAPFFSVLAARRFVDLMYFYPGENDEHLIREIKKIPEVIVIRDHENLEKFIEKCDCVLFGIGVNNAKLNVKKLYNSKKLVIDGDGLRLMRMLILKNRIKPNTIITPHEGEFNYLFNCNGTKENVVSMAKKHSIIILKKDPKGDLISDGKKLIINKTHNQGMTKGGTGDVLSGLVAALSCRNDALKSTVAAACITGYAGNMLKNKMGFNFAASDLANELAFAYQKLSK